ncbi:aspartyl protease family protein [Candidatus Gottesmanbacteria bacterium]|nr:aspartyl protease family protein [Candidatus Gottesmanbacteria bacterium]
MGITTISAKISSVKEPQKQIVEKCMVDTGAAYTVVPYASAKKLGLKAVKTQEFVLVDGTSVKRKLGHAFVEIDGDRAPSTVVIGEKGDFALIGVVTLENMGLMVDPFKRKLRPMRLILS